MLGTTKGAQSARKLILGMMLASMVITTAAAPAFASDPKDARAAATGIGTTLSPGDLVADHGVSVRVPAPGETVWAAAEFADGTVQELQIVTSLTGQVSVLERGDEREASLSHAVSSESPAHPDAHARGGGECRDTAFRLFSWRTPVYRWSYAARTTPRKFTQRRHGVQQVVRSLLRANRAVTNGRNVCGRGDRIKARYQYLGRTKRLPGIRGASCGGGDGHSVIGWGALPNHSIAFVCVYARTGRRSKEADIVLSTKQPYEATRSRCRGAFLIEAPMTHEFGHVYGLGHVGPRSLTMNSHVSWCSTAETTLGMGDLFGLERKY